MDFGECQGGSFETRAAARFAEAFQGFSAGQELGELLATSFLKAGGATATSSFFFFGKQEKRISFPVFFLGLGGGRDVGEGCVRYRLCCNCCLLLEFFC